MELEKAIQELVDELGDRGISADEAKEIEDQSSVLQLRRCYSALHETYSTVVQGRFGISSAAASSL